MAGLSEKVKRSFSKFGTATSYKPCRIVHSQLVHVKDKKCDLVYGIRCGDPSCTKTDIGETRQTLKAHMNQHRYPAYEEALNSAVYMHLNLHGHSLDKSSGHLGAKKSGLLEVQRNPFGKKLNHHLSSVGQSYNISSTQSAIVP